MPHLFFFSKIALVTWSLLCLYRNFTIYHTTSMKEAIDNLVKIALNLQIVLSSIVTFRVLIFPVQNQSISFNNLFLFYVEKYLQGYKQVKKVAHFGICLNIFTASANIPGYQKLQCRNTLLFSVFFKVYLGQDNTLLYIKF